MRRWVGSACHQPPRRTEFVYHKAPSSSDRTVVNFFLGLHTMPGHLISIQRSQVSQDAKRYSSHFESSWSLVNLDYVRPDRNTAVDAVCISEEIGYSHPQNWMVHR